MTYKRDLRNAKGGLSSGRWRPTGRGSLHRDNSGQDHSALGQFMVLGFVSAAPSHGASLKTGIKSHLSRPCWRTRAGSSLEMRDLFYGQQYEGLGSGHDKRRAPTSRWDVGQV